MTKVSSAAMQKAEGMMGRFAGPRATATMAQFIQQVSDVAKLVLDNRIYQRGPDRVGECIEGLKSLILPDDEPEIELETEGTTRVPLADIRAALDAAGYEIKRKD